MATSRSLLVLKSLLLLATIFLVIVPLSIAATSKSQAMSALSDADGAVISAYSAVSKADAVGANVTEMLARLSEAGDVLNRARRAYDAGDYDSALELATLCQEKLTGFVTDAEELTRVGARDRSIDFMANVIAPIAGSLSVVCLSSVAWVYSNRRYGKTRS